MHSQPSDEHPEPFLSEEQRKDAHRNQAERLVALAARVLRKDRDWHTPASELKLCKLSGQLARRRKKPWAASDQKLWDQLLDACYDSETESLGQKYGPKKAKKLVKREWARWDAASRRLVTESDRPNCDNVVPVVVVQREEGFKIHDEILLHLWDHPLLADDLAAAEGQDFQTVFANTLKRVESIERKHDLYDGEHTPLIAEQDGPDRSAAACSLAALDLRSALDERSGGGHFKNDDGSNFFKDEDDLPEGEDLAWLTDAKRGRHLWSLLNAAVELGWALEHYTTFQGSEIEETVRQMLIGVPGKSVSPEGKAVEQLIKCFLEDTQSKIKPTPKNLLKWLASRCPNDAVDTPGVDKPLEVDHPPWWSVLEKITESDFENLVKGARRRM